MIVFVLTSGCAWRHLPPSFGVTVPTAHQRLSVWTEAGLWGNPHRAVLDRLGAQGLIDWSRAVFDGAAIRVKGGFSNRAEPGRPGQERLEDPRLIRPCGHPLGGRGLRGQPERPSGLADDGHGHPAHPLPARTHRFRTAKRHADKAYDVAELHTWLRRRGIMVRVAREGIDTSQKLGRHRWVIERTNRFVARDACVQPQCEVP